MTIIAARDLHVGDHVILAPGTRAVEITGTRADDALTMLAYADSHGHPGACQRAAQENVQLADDSTWRA